MTSGFQRSELVIVAARPSMGKTAFCLNIAANAALGRAGGRDLLAGNVQGVAGPADAHAPRRGWTASGCGRARCATRDFTQLARAAGILQTYQLWIDDTPSLTLLEMRSKARRLKIDNDVGLIMVDYLQLMRSPEYAENRVQEISDISRSLKALARELEIPVIALSQLSRASEQRGGERQADPVRPAGLGRHRAGRRPRDLHPPAGVLRPGGRDPKRGLAEVMLAKNRNGPTGDVQLKFTREYTRFDNFSDREDPE